MHALPDEMLAIREAGEQIVACLEEAGRAMRGDESINRGKSPEYLAHKVGQAKANQLDGEASSLRFGWHLDDIAGKEGIFAEALHEVAIRHGKSLYVLMLTDPCEFGIVLARLANQYADDEAMRLGGR